MSLNETVWSHPARRWIGDRSAQRDADWLSRIHDLWRELASCTPSELREHAESARRRAVADGVQTPDMEVLAFAMAAEALRRENSLELYDVQFLAAKTLARGGVAEMQTGEGKTFACVPAAVLHALSGRGVHIATPNEYLAERDCHLVSKALRRIEMTVGLVLGADSVDEKRAAYRCDITYSTAHEFGFDYLRDQLTLRAESQKQLGERAIQCLAGEPPLADRLIQRDLHYTIVDEADNILLDDAASPLILSAPCEAEAPDAAAHRLAARVASELAADEHFEIDPLSGKASLTSAGVERIHARDYDVPIATLRRTWSEYVIQAVHARLLDRDIHYIVDAVRSTPEPPAAERSVIGRSSREPPAAERSVIGRSSREPPAAERSVIEGAVQIVDTSTGRIFSDRSWQDGLHQAVEAKEQLPITAERLAIAQITRQRFFRMYQRLAGMTGTAAGCEHELRHVYGLDVVSIALRTPSQREIWPTRVFHNKHEKWLAIAKSIAEIHATGRPVLVGTRTIADSETMADLMRDRGLEFELLNGVQHAEEAHVIAQAGRMGAITIATSLAGRGTDIKLNNDVRQIGGLHVVVCECDFSGRIDRQMIGRCARQGDPGSAQTFVSAEDMLIQRYGRWLIPSIQRLANGQGECEMDLTKPLARIQRTAERTAYAARAAMLRLEQARDALFSR